MAFRQIVIYLIILLLAFSARANEKSVVASQTSESIKIDGVLDELAWKSANRAADFIQYYPVNGGIPSQRSVVSILYDNKSIYIGAILFDSSPDSILTELGKRDVKNLNADYFAIDISPYNDGQNSFEFRVLASGVQVDIKHSSSDSDTEWDAVWSSAVSINDQGWIAELEIPYSAIRFPNAEVQEWGINFWREIRRIREVSTWNFVNKRVDGIRNQSGTLEGIRGVKPPLRLSMEPYLSGYMEKQPGNEKMVFAYNYGADIKYGINESFTLDVTLIPDFGQVPSDDEIVNLSPFETYYSEKRQFFTEGTELFSRGDIFYSRRIGGTPERYHGVDNDLSDNEFIEENPGETQLLNASKVSGRTGKGLGIGIFNAMTDDTYARIHDSSGYSRSVLTQPFTNYNMVVFDQSFRKNSYVSFYNTNVLMAGFDYSANVSGTQFRLADRKNIWAISGLINISQKYQKAANPDIGHRYYIRGEKISGNFLFGAWQNSESDRYDPNDMGFLSRNNQFNNGLFFEYNIYDPFGMFLNMEHELDIDLKQLYAPRKYVEFDIDYTLHTVFVNRMTAWFEAEISPFESHDYYEARVSGRKVVHPPSYSLSAFISPDYTKKFLVDAGAGYQFSNRYDQQGYHVRLAPRVRFSDNVFMTYRFYYSMRYNNLGYVSDSLGLNGEDIVTMGFRDVQNIENTLNLTLTFSPSHSVSFRMRHYWFTVDYNEYLTLKDDGSLGSSDYETNHSFNYNAFNIDAFYTWRFAPGSEMVVAWKNAIVQDQEELIYNFFEDIRHTFSIPGTNSFSVKFLYYLDYQKLKKKRTVSG